MISYDGNHHGDVNHQMGVIVISNEVAYIISLIMSSFLLLIIILIYIICRTLGRVMAEYDRWYADW